MAKALEQSKFKDYSLELDKMKSEKTGDYALGFIDPTKGLPKFRILKWTRKGEEPVPKEAGSWVIPIETEPNTFYIIRLNDTDLFHVHIAEGKFVRLNITRTAMKQFDSE